jgi:hypothetical protein
MRMAGGACCLLGADRLCTLHKVFGAEAKPNICRSFPVRFVQAPDGIFAGLSFACTAVLGNEGPPLEERRAELEELLTWTASRTVIDKPPPLATGIALTWDQYHAVEEDLTAMLEPQNGGIEQRLIMQYVYLHLLIKLLREARSQKGELAAGAEANEAPLAVFRRRARAASADGRPWAMLQAIAGRRRGSALLRRMILGFADSLRNTYGRPRGRLGSYLMVFTVYLRQATGRGILDLPMLGGPVKYRRMRQVRLDPDRPELEELLTRYFRHRLFRKDLLTADTVQWGLQMQMLYWGMIHWYSAAMAADRGRDEVGLEELSEALRAVEKYYVFHSTMNRLFVRLPLLRGFLDYTFSHPLFGFSMGRVM